MPRNYRTPSPVLVPGQQITDKEVFAFARMLDAALARFYNAREVQQLEDKCRQLIPVELHPFKFLTMRGGKLRDASAVHAAQYLYSELGDGHLDPLDLELEISDGYTYMIGRSPSDDQLVLAVLRNSSLHLGLCASASDPFSSMVCSVQNNKQVALMTQAATGRLIVHCLVPWQSLLSSSVEQLLEIPEVSEVVSGHKLQRAIHDLDQRLADLSKRADVEAAVDKIRAVIPVEMHVYPLLIDNNLSRDGTYIFQTAAEYAARYRQHYQSHLDAADVDQFSDKTLDQIVINQIEYSNQIKYSKNVVCLSRSSTIPQHLNQITAQIFRVSQGFMVGNLGIYFISPNDLDCTFLLDDFLSKTQEELIEQERFRNIVSDVILYS